MKKKVLVVMLFCVIAIGYAKQHHLIAAETEDSEHKKAWSYYDNNETEKALEIVSKWNKPESAYRENWAVLLGLIYVRLERYKEALNAINDIRPRLENGYLIDKYLSQSIVTEEESATIKFLYYKMLFVSSVANYRLNNCVQAIKDSIAYIEKYPNFLMFNIIGVCYYKSKNYSKAIEYFKQSYKLLEHDIENSKVKEAVSYNIGALNAILGNVSEAIEWLRFPLERDKDLWLEKIKKDKDFDLIRENITFKNFLMSYDLKNKPESEEIGEK